MQDKLNEIVERAEAVELIVYPGFPEGATIARWPTHDIDAFLDLAKQAAASPLLYVTTLTAEQVADAGHVTVDGTGFDADQTVTVLAGWIAGPVLHTLAITDSAWELALDNALEDADVARFRDEIEWQQLDEEAEAYARQVVTDPAFHDHGSQGRDAKKFAAVQRLLPDVDEQMAWRVVPYADRIDRAEFQTDREAGQAEQARALMAEGATKRAAATELGISVNVLNRILQTNPVRT